jgi:hypothetical protein
MRGRPVDPNHAVPASVAYTTSHVLASNINSSPFILDMGATIHILPVCADFKRLCPIALHPITSIGGARIYATRVGSIELCIAGGLKVSLNNTVYIPASTVHLVSILKLNKGGWYTFYFN